MSDKRYTVKDLVAEHPVVDHLPPLVACLIWFSFLRGLNPPHVVEFLIGLATVAALVLTAATFVCAQVYQNSTPRVVDIRTTFADAIRRNWTSIFVLTFVAAVAPLAALLLIGSGPWAPLLGIWSGTMLAVKAQRTHYWLRTILFMQSVEDRVPQEPYVVPVPKRNSA